MDLKSLNKKKLLEHLDSEIITLLEVARVTLDSWPMRMQVELKTGITESKLESLLELMAVAVDHASGGGAEVKSPSYTSHLRHKGESKPACHNKLK